MDGMGLGWMNGYSIGWIQKILNMMIYVGSRQEVHR